MATAVERLEAVLPRTKSSESNLLISSETARELVEALPDGDLKDRLAAVTPTVKSSVANTTFSQSLGEEVVAELSE